MACVLVNVLDGFDILIMSVAAKAVGSGLSLSTPQLGLMFSSGLAGMMCGALLLAPLSDRFGRRSLILGCLAINAVGMFATGTAENLRELLLFRFVTGLGVGGMMPTVNTAIAEVVHPRRRELAVLIQCAAYPAGGVLATLLWAWLTPDRSWHEVLQLASIPSLVCIALVVAWLPETVPFLLASRPANALERINATLKRSGQPLLQALPPMDSSSNRSGALAALTGASLRNLVSLALATFLAQFSFYFFVSWLPTILSSSATEQSAPWAGTILLNAGGIAGDFMLAALTLKVSLRRLASGIMVLAFGSGIAIASVLNEGALAVAVAAFAGAALYAAMASLYAFAPTVFPTLARAAGTGIAFSVGRLGGALSPAVGAVLLSRPGLPLALALSLMAAPVLIAAFVIGFLRPSSTTQIPAIIVDHV